MIDFPLIDPDRNPIVDLPARGRMPKSVHVIDSTSIHAINAALVTHRPLLIRGEPGTGKSQLARAAAEMLGRVLVPHSVDARTETRDLLWTVDLVARLAEAQILAAFQQKEPDPEKLLERVAILRFVQPGPIWWAFDWTSAEKQATDFARIRKDSPNPGAHVLSARPHAPRDWTPADGAVVLIDEIDKADPSVPNGLLDALGHGCFDVPGRPAVEMKRESVPLVIITTNEERSLPDAFLRRCLVLHLDLPADDDAFVTNVAERGRAHFAVEKCSDKVLREAATVLLDDRKACKRRGLNPPGLAEYIDLLTALTRQKRGDTHQIELLKIVKTFTFEKHAKDEP